MTVQKLVRLSGKVFWDLDADGSPGFTEGLANATVSLGRKRREPTNHNQR
ncbi:MAG: hypothetical protein CM15mP105_2450 [Methanobacteriota archaeon]|nr:MAG: hypothetical protein CM15mP105_2450 [Euryarchaeota archaeon]